MPPDLRSEIERILEQGPSEAKAAIDASIERARELLVAQSGNDAERSESPAPSEPHWISLEQAAPIRGVTRQTMSVGTVYRPCQPDEASPFSDRLSDRVRERSVSAHVANPGERDRGRHADICRTSQLDDS